MHQLSTGVGYRFFWEGRPQAQDTCKHKPIQDKQYVMAFDSGNHYCIRSPPEGDPPRSMASQKSPLRNKKYQAGSGRKFPNQYLIPKSLEIRAFAPPTEPPSTCTGACLFCRAAENCGDPQMDFTSTIGPLAANESSCSNETIDKNKLPAQASRGACTCKRMA